MTSLSNILSQNLFNTVSMRAFFEPIAQLFDHKVRLDSPRSFITGVNWNNKNCYSIAIRPNKTWKGFKAGQFVQLTISKDGSFLSRCFSISSSPSHFHKTGEIKLTIRTQDKGTVTPWMIENLKSGDAVYLSEAMGDFTIQASAKQKLFIAGGSGITPIISMLKEHENSLWLRQAHLVFYVTSPSERLFVRELNELRLQGFSYEFIFTATQGRFTLTDIEKNIPDFAEREVYICGPGGLINAVTTTLSENGTPKKQIFSERFGPSITPASLEGELSDEAVYIEYKHSGISSEIKLGEQKQTLLEIAENKGLKPVSGCRIGVCHQCICKKEQGRVFNTKTQTVSDTGAEEIQLCLSVPLEHVTLEL